MGKPVFKDCFEQSQKKRKYSSMAKCLLGTLEKVRAKERKKVGERVRVKLSFYKRLKTQFKFKISKVFSHKVLLMLIESVNSIKD